MNHCAKNMNITLVSVAILISTFGCANGLILGGARVFYAMARDGLFFRAAGKLDPVRQTPRVALVAQGVWSAVLALSGKYEQLLTYVTFASLAFNALVPATKVIDFRHRGRPGRS